MLAFVDTSGDFLSRPNKCRHIVVAATVMKASSIARITRIYHSMRRDLLANVMLEIKATEFVNKDTLNNPERNKNRFITELFNKCLGRRDMYHFAIVIPNQDVHKYFPRDRLAKHYVYLLQRIQRLAVRHREANALVIIDNSNRRVDHWATQAFNNYLFRSEPGRKLDRILQMPVFADSEMTIGIQLADIVAGTIRQYFDNNLQLGDEPRDLFETRIKEFYGLIAGRSPDFGKYRGMHYAQPDFIERYYSVNLLETETDE
ncbi:MAG: DUF3800 domain-containing protein [Bacillota bacterium]